MPTEQTALQRIAEAKQQQFTELYLCDCQLRKIPAELLELIWLQQLDLSLNNIQDLTPLTKLTQLTALNLNGNQISDLTPLANLTQLTKLHLSENQISDLAPLANQIKGSANKSRGQPMIYFIKRCQLNVSIN